jgi:hypothetical protein
MKRRLLNKIVRPHVSRLRVLVANVGIALGLAGLLLAVQLHDDFEAIFHGAGGEEAKNDFLIISKPVGLGNTLTFKSPTFSEEEIERIKAQPFVKRLGAITGNTFKVSTAPAGPLRFYSDLFVETVPKELLDEVPPDWSWKEGEEQVPAVMSNEFLNLYNFVFAPSQGLPPLTREALMIMPLPITIGTAGDRMEIKARIVGFSHRIPSIMVPESFLRWANARYGTEAEPAPSRIIIEVADASDPALSSFLREESLETNRDRLRRSRTAAAAQIAVIVTGIISLLIAGLSVLLAAMNAQLLISRSASALSLLVHLAYRRAYLVRWLLLKHAVFLVVVVLMALAVFLYCLAQVRDLFLENGFTPPSQTGPAAYVALLAFALVALLFQLVAVRGGLLKATRTFDDMP